MTKALNVLFLCTGNSARSILAETVLNHSGHGRFHAYSAGSRPAGRVNPHAIETLLAHELTASDARSKSWDEFAAPGAPAMDIIITVCDSAAGETCPIWPGHPMTAHWGMPDPAAATGNEAEVRAAFERTYQTISRLTACLAALPDEALAPERVRASLAEIGRDVLGEEQ
jgi:protein-tyrosine-phosphatase